MTRVSQRRAWKMYLLRAEEKGWRPRSTLASDEEWSILLSVKKYLRMIDVSDVDGIDAEGDVITLVRTTKHED